MPAKTHMAMLPPETNFFLVYGQVSALFNLNPFSSPLTMGTFSCSCEG